MPLVTLRQSADLGLINCVVMLASVSKHKDRGQSYPTSDVYSITIEYGVPNSGGNDQTVVYKTIPVSRT
jgi:hypothetical protein